MTEMKWDLRKHNMDFDAVIFSVFCMPTLALRTVIILFHTHLKHYSAFAPVKKFLLYN